MKATAKQKQLIHVNTQKSELKEELVQWACNDNDKTSCNDLNFDQANHILKKLGIKPHQPHVDWDAFNYGKFDKSNFAHMKVLATLMTIGWTKPHPRFGSTADLERFGAWLRSEKSPVRKKLMAMDKQEVSKIIVALESMTVKKFKANA